MLAILLDRGDKYPRSVVLNRIDSDGIAESAELVHLLFINDVTRNALLIAPNVD